MTLRLRFWGTRGSIPAPGSHTVRYGGNTPCVEVRSATNALVVLDAGTGIRDLGHSLVGELKGAWADGGIHADIFLTHAHWDHIQGIPFFAPIFQAGNKFRIRASSSLDPAIDQVLREQMAPVVFPVAFDELRSQVEFGAIADGDHQVGDGYEVSAFAVQHPGGALGYRFSSRGDGGGAFVYISDNELGSTQLYGSRSTWRNELIEFIRGAAVLVHDATYTAEEYERHRGWGHSTAEDSVALALDAKVDRLVLFHHKPERSDIDIDNCVTACRALVERRGARLEVTAAAEGMTMRV